MLGNNPVSVERSTLDTGVVKEKDRDVEVALPVVESLKSRECSGTRRQGTRSLTDFFTRLGGGGTALNQPIPAPARTVFWSWLGSFLGIFVLSALHEWEVFGGEHCNPFPPRQNWLPRS